MSAARPIRRPASRLVLVLSATALVSGIAQAADQGEMPFNNNCRTCHSAKAGDNRLGPSLGGVVGRKAGTEPGYGSYSEALKNSGVVWDEATLDRFIANPDKVVPNNQMKPFAGVPDEAVRRQIIAYLKSQSQSQSQAKADPQE
jgi:cytochrome c